MLVLVTGLPGCGKSYFAERFAPKISACYLSTDLLRKKIIKNKTYSASEKELVYESIRTKAKRHLMNKNNVIIDGTFYQNKMRELFRNLAIEQNAVFKIIEIVADEEVTKKRVSKKRLHSDADFEVYQMIKSNFEPVTTNHLIIESKNDNLDEMIEKALKYLEK